MGDFLFSCIPSAASAAGNTILSAEDVPLLISSGYVRIANLVPRITNP
jgi:hypothetical protein